MIVLAELRFMDWEHEDCNGGMIRLISQIASEEVYFVAHKTHIDAIKKIGMPDNVKCREIEFEKFLLPQRREQEIQRKQLVEKIIRDLKLGKNDKVFFLSSAMTIMNAAIDANMQHNIPFYFIMHADLDGVLSEACLNGDEYNYTSIIERAGQCEFSHFIVFNPFAKEKLKGFLSDCVLRKMFFLHLPMYGEKVYHEIGNKSVIGIYGACVNSKNFIPILKRLQAVKYEDYLIFEIHRRIPAVNQMDYSYKFPKRGTKVRQFVWGFTGEERHKFFSRLDWILLPYDGGTYQTSMSGILADAIAYEKPILALNSQIIKWYNQKPIGIVADSVEALCEIMYNDVGLNNSRKYAEYCHNITTVKKETEIENIRIMQHILKKVRSGDDD